jgi:DNA-binding transcriptional ArsR family regulator
MSDAGQLAALAALIGDPTRSRMLACLMSGQALTATELAAESGVSASTASTHLARLTSGGVLEVRAQGRHRYFRLADTDIAAALEALMGVATAQRRSFGPADPALRAARVCYDHLAGEAGVRLHDALRAHALLQADGGALTDAGEAWCRRRGLDLDALQSPRRPLCRPCLDWSERRDHLAGALGAALLQDLLRRGHARRIPGSRALRLDRAGLRFVESLG